MPSPWCRHLFLASDHAGIALKAHVIEHLTESGLTVEDLGPVSSDSVDYPDYAHRLCQKVLGQPGSGGILICGSGIGMSIAANRHRGIRAALVYTEEAARLSRRHNDANVLCLGARLAEDAVNLAAAKTFLATAFEGGRHAGRVAKIDPA